MTSGQAVFQGFQQGNQHGSGAEGSSDDTGGFVTVGVETRAQSAAPGPTGRRGRDQEPEREFVRRRIPQASPRATTATTQQGVGMEVMFQQFLTAMTQLLQQGAVGQAQGGQRNQGSSREEDRGEERREDNNYRGAVKLDEKFFKKVKNFRGGTKKKEDDIDRLGYLTCWWRSTKWTANWGWK